MLKIYRVALSEGADKGLWENILVLAYTLEEAAKAALKDAYAGVTNGAPDGLGLEFRVSSVEELPGRVVFASPSRLE